MDAGRAERGIFLNFFRKMSALSAQRHVLRSILGCSGPIFMMSVGLGGGVRLCGWRWLIREGHEFSRKTGAAGRWPDG